LRSSPRASGLHASEGHNPFALATVPRRETRERAGRRVIRRGSLAIQDEILDMNPLQLRGPLTGDRSWEGM